MARGGHNATGKKLDDPVAHREARRWLRGQGSDAPPWLVLMTLADGDPLRAQQMEEDLSEEWARYGIAYRAEKTRLEQQELRRGQRKTTNYRRR